MCDYECLLFEMLKFAGIGFHYREKGVNMVATLGRNSEFSEVDINNVKSLEAALKGDRFFYFLFNIYCP